MNEMSSKDNANRNMQNGLEMKQETEDIGLGQLSTHIERGANDEESILSMFSGYNKELSLEQNMLRYNLSEGCQCPVDFMEILGKWNEDIKLESSTTNTQNAFRRGLDAISFEGSREPTTSEIITYSELVLAHKEFSSLQYLEKLRCMSLEARNVSKVLFECWMKTPHFTKTILSLCVQAEPKEKNRREKTVAYFNAIIYFAEHFCEEMFQIDVVDFILKKLTTALRLLVCWQNEGSLNDVHTEPVKIILERTYLRYYGAVHKSLEKPFTKLTMELVQISKFGFFAQRTLAHLLSQLGDPIPTQFARDLFHLQVDHGNGAPHLLYPSNLFLTVDNTDWRKAMVYNVPFRTDTRCTSFWRNWASYVTLDITLLNSIWQEYLNEVWIQCTDENSVVVRATAFIALGSALKTVLSKNRAMMDLILPSVFESYQNMLQSTSVKIHGANFAIAYMLFDLMSLQVPTSDTTARFNEQQIIFQTKEYEYLVRFYEGSDTKVDELENNITQQHRTDSKKENPEEEDSAGSSSLKEHVQSLRGAGLIPSSFMNICDIASGSTKASDESQTETLQHLAVLWIPILLQADQTVDDETATLLTMFLSDSFAENRCKEFCVIAAHDLCLKYPQSVCKALYDYLDSPNYSLGQKASLIDLAHKLLFYAGDVCCTRCFNTTAEDDRQKLLTRAMELEPLFVTDYLELQPSRCYRCKEALKNINKLTKEVSEEAGTAEGANDGAKVSKTRTWGKQKDVPKPQVADKFSPHLSIWNTVYMFLVKNLDKFKIDGPNATDALFVLKIVQLLKFIMLTYNSIPEYLYGLVPNVVHLIENITINHVMRQEVWSTFKYLVLKNEKVRIYFFSYMWLKGIDREFFLKHLHRHQGKYPITDSIICEIMESFTSSDSAADSPTAASGWVHNLIIGGSLN